MDHKLSAYARIALVALAIAALTGAPLPAYAQDPQPSVSPGSVWDNSPLDPAATLTEAPVPLPDPIITGGMPTLFATSASPSDDRDNSTPTAWYIWAHQTAQHVTDTINSGYRLVDIYVETTSPSHLFTGVYVANSGSYQKVASITWSSVNIPE